MLRFLSESISPKAATGTYKCVVKTAEDEAEREFRVEVAQAPIIAPLPEEQFVLVGGAVRLRCEAEGIPRPEASWDDGGYPELGMLNVREGTDQESILKFIPVDVGEPIKLVK